MAKLIPQLVADFIFDVLKNDAAFSAAVGGRIYRDEVPASAALPAAIVGPVVSAPPTNTLSGTRVWLTVALDVHIVAGGSSYAPINDAAWRADALLQNRSGTSGGALISELVADEPRFYLEHDAGESFVHILQTFRTPAYTLA